MRYAMLALALSICGCGVAVSEPLDKQVMQLFGEGKYADAEPLAKQAIEQSIKKNGPDHPDTATSLSNLAVLYRTQGKYDLAEPLYKHSLLILEKTLGPDHPRTIKVSEDLASMQAYREAEATAK